VRPHPIEGHSPVRVDQEDRISHLPAIAPVHSPRVVIDQHGPIDPLCALVLPGLRQLLLVGMIRAAKLTRVCLTDKDVNEVHLVAVPSVEFFDRCDRTDGDRSGEAANVYYHRSPAQRAQP
jgi:hypothetical protein